jgi:cyanate lyase
MRQRDLHADGWHLYGLVLQALNNETLGDEIMEAFVISMECQQHNPVRPFATVLV